MEGDETSNGRRTQPACPHSGVQLASDLTTDERNPPVWELLLMVQFLKLPHFTRNCSSRWVSRISGLSSFFLSRQQ